MSSFLPISDDDFLTRIHVGDLISVADDDIFGVSGERFLYHFGIVLSLDKFELDHAIIFFPNRLRSWSSMTIVLPTNILAVISSKRN